MQIDVLTLFPGPLQAYLAESIVHRAQAKGAVRVNVVDIRDYARDKHRTVDDTPYGGGPGMVLKPDPIFDALDAQQLWQAHKVYLTPQGRVLDQGLAHALACVPHVVLLCGHYEGVDQRVLDVMDAEISIGDYVLSNGAVAAMVVIDAIARLLPGVLGNAASAANDSFVEELLEYPQYTRPPEYRGARVPDVLLGGNHAAIDRWRRAQALARTQQRRPDLWERYSAARAAAGLATTPAPRAAASSSREDDRPVGAPAR
jgi:tRNA (guanine37-N1)-methyltransferase